MGIIASASLPWLTGASIAPLFHGVYLKKQGFDVTLYLPWAPLREQRKFLGAWTLRRPEEVAGYIRHWLGRELGAYLPEIRLYPAWYSRLIKSVLSVKDLDAQVSNHDAVVLEEPEHLFWCQPWSRFRRNRPRVLGIVMTHYAYYHANYLPGALVRLLHEYSLMIMRRVCRRIVAIAPVEARTLKLKHARVIPLNAVRPEFFRTCGRGRGCYFMGKLIPEKGMKELFQGLGAAGIREIDLFGQGDESSVSAQAGRFGVLPRFRGETNRPWLDAAGFRVFVNCSRSEYFCTTTANALAMQQWVIVPRHPSNRVFYGFKNCLAYRNPDEFAAHLAYTFSNRPALDPSVSSLSWEVAAERLARLIRED